MHRGLSAPSRTRPVSPVFRPDEGSQHWESVGPACDGPRMTDENAGRTGPTMPEGGVPSQVTEDHWVWDYDPSAQEFHEGDRPGKWLVFVYVEQLDAWWQTISAAVRSGRLGPEAKSATARETPTATNSRAKPIIVFTRDYRDTADVARVLGVLRDLGVYWRLSYKADEDTLAGRYGRGASIYVSQPDARDFEDRRPGGR